MEEKKFNFPTEVIDLPSKGLLYPESSALSSGTVEMKYMTAKEEDILTNQSYIQKGVVLDKLLQALIVSKIDYNELLVGDKNAIMVAARVLGYGKDYEFSYAGEKRTVDLSQVDAKSFSLEVEKGKNEFAYTLPRSGTNITFKFLTHGDDNKIDQELKGLRKINKDITADISTRMKYMITSVEGDDSPKTIREFVDNYLLAADSRALRKYVRDNQPDVNLTFEYEDADGVVEDVEIPIGVDFFWPDAGL